MGDGWLSRRWPPQARVLGVLAGLVTLALEVCGKYREWWWYDNLAHLSAGVLIGSLFTTEESTTGQDLGVALAVSILWELGEYVRDVRPWDETVEPDSDWPAEDTVLDTVLLVLGTWWAARERARAGSESESS